MTKPVYKIETYTGAVLDHTITKDAVSVYFKEVVTDGIGHFMLIVPTKKNGGYFYNDILLADKIKIWMGYDSISGPPDFIGKVGKISARLSVQSGYLRVISGLSQGEILLRRFKTNKYYNEVGASTIVTEWANDLNLGTGDIAADATAVTLEVKTKRYFDLLREISDYWYDADTKIKKDFYVDVDNDLVWKSRPLRTSDVETLTVGDNIISYRVTRDVDAVRNDVMVYGALERSQPTDRDSWTESLTGWSASEGTLSLEDNVSYVKAGTYSIKCTSDGEETAVEFKLSKNIRSVLNTLNKLYFWINQTTSPSTEKLKLFAPNESNRFEIADLGLGITDWEFREYGLGREYEKDAVTNPDGIWTVVGSPSWWDINAMEFELRWPGFPVTCWIDGLYFFPDRWKNGIGHSQSIIDYGARYLEVTDDKLHSNSDCLKRAGSLLDQMANPTVQIDVTTPGNTNILVGDRLSMTIPAEGINAHSYDVISVEHSFSRQGFITKAVMVNSANIRKPVTTDPMRLLGDLRRHVKELSIDEKLIR